MGGSSLKFNSSLRKVFEQPLLFKEKFIETYLFVQSLCYNVLDKRINAVSKALLLLFFLALAYYFAYYYIHNNYNLPYHADEWDHLAIAKEITVTDQLVNYNPYRGWGWDPQWEQNYHLFQAMLLNLTNWDITDLGIVQLALFIPVLMTFLMILFTFILIKQLTGSNAAAFLSALTVLLTRPNVTILGYWFSVPMAFGLAFIPLVLFLFVKSFSEEKGSFRYSILLFVIFAQLTLVHPASATIFLPAFMIYLLLQPKLLLKSKTKIILLVLELGILVLLLIGYSVYNYSVTTQGGLFDKIMETITFTTSIYETNVFFFLPRYLSWPIFFVAIAGMLYLLNTKNRQAIILPILIITLVPLIYLFFTEERTYLADYRRIFYYAAESLVICAGVGIYAIIKFLNAAIDKALEGYYFFSEKISLSVLPKAFVALLALGFLYSNISTLPFTHKDQLYKVAEENEVPAFLWLKHNSFHEQIVLSYFYTSRAVNVIGGDRILYANPARLMGARGQEESIEFFASGCDWKEKNLNGASFVYSRDAINCDFLEEVFAKGESHVYKVK